ncbi:ATP-binding cassette domain-containing protein [Exiguobacterium flavidum]|uniref:ATP-binding cassette domain-containing protein n=1 Tax=Exiguobacterium flavidum TaxID=2184695 RepID=UPI000DF83E9E|nr:ABC transporter ATP-binding protein [Exiguobacterium flavidum]
MIEMKKLGKRYDDVFVLQPLSEVIGKGRIIALCGSNGAGKSTLLSLLTGAAEQSEGEVLMNGISPSDKRRYNLQFGYMPDDFEFVHGLTVEKTLEYFAVLQGHEVADQLERTGLTMHLKKRVSDLSKGMRQRLLLAQALLSSPEVLLLDEPTNGLDPAWVVTLGDILQEEADEGTTIVFSTHQLDAAAKLADEIWLMREGVIKEKLSGLAYRETLDRLHIFFGN